MILLLYVVDMIRMNHINQSEDTASGQDIF